MILKKIISVLGYFCTKFGQKSSKKLRAGRNTVPQLGGVGGVMFSAQIGGRSCNQAFCDCC